MTIPHDGRCQFAYASMSWAEWLAAKAYPGRISSSDLSYRLSNLVTFPPSTSLRMCAGSDQTLAYPGMKTVKSRFDRQLDLCCFDEIHWLVIRPNGTTTYAVRKLSTALFSPATRYEKGGSLVEEHRRKLDHVKLPFPDLSSIGPRDYLITAEGRMHRLLNPKQGTYPYS